MDKSSRRNFQRQIVKKSDRKIRTRKEAHNIWSGLRMFGMVGWSVSIPSVLGVALGVWIDKNFESQYSWTLMLLFIGVALGCFNAWYWISKESSRD